MVCQRSVSGRRGGAPPRKEIVPDPYPHSVVVGRGVMVFRIVLPQFIGFVVISDDDYKDPLVPVIRRAKRISSRRSSSVVFLNSSPR
jgi:hypothetical protein